MEAYTAIARALACPKPPRRVIVSLGAGHFMTPDLFWERSVKFGFIGTADVALLRHESERLDDWSVYAEQHGDRLRGRVRAALYAIRFPSLYFANVAKGGVLLRLWENRRALAAVLAARGQSYFGTADGSADVAAEGHLGAFRPLPILDAYFDRMLALLAARGIAVDLVPMPVNHATRLATDPGLRADRVLSASLCAAICQCARGRADAGLARPFLRRRVRSSQPHRSDAAQRTPRRMLGGGQLPVPARLAWQQGVGRFERAESKTGTNRERVLTARSHVTRPASRRARR